MTITINRISGPLSVALLALLLAACKESGPSARDFDGDGVIDGSDNCVNIANADQANFDGDALGDVCDDDDDNDLAPDALDDFPRDSSQYLDLDGDGIGLTEDTDNDGDGVLDVDDNCPYIANATQGDSNGIDDGAGLGDACELSKLTDTGLYSSGKVPDGNDRSTSTVTMPTGNKSTVYTPVCAATNIALMQDCNQGKDHLFANRRITKTGAGIGSLDYTKIGSNGRLLDATETSWQCVLDHNTDLMWERKQSGDISNTVNLQTDRFFWYMPEGDNGGIVGTQDDETERLSVPGLPTCQGFEEEDTSTWCNTDAFINRMNAANYCGYDDWRLPTIAELQSIQMLGAAIDPEDEIVRTNEGNNFSVIDPRSIDRKYFSLTQSARYWTVTTNARLPEKAWTIDHRFGVPSIEFKETGFAARLVRDGSE